MKALLSLIFWMVSTAVFSQDFKSLPMWNTGVPVEKRVHDLVSRLTLEEKVAQMMHSTPAVPRLGIKAYDWWNETLHGVARTPYRTTSYPQAIGMAATWDTAALRLMGFYSAVEGRAVHNLALAEGRENERYLGLTYWTPNINIFRDPRWGRGQETYGEDPYLTSMLGASFVHGLQGDHPFYLQAAACAKHFAVHSGPESSRHSDNFNPSAYDLWDTYLPAFRKLVVDAQVAGVMCAYNAVYEEPCCANNLLMQDILRKQWNFTGYVTSDCWGLDDFFRYHKTHTDATASAVDALIHSTDLECGQTVYRTLVEAVRSGIVKETEIDVALHRLFTIRYRLGMFDPPEMVPLARTPASALEAPEHNAHALKMARESIVLLKNANNTLPLNKQIRRIAVIGPNADNPVSVLGNYNGVPSKIVTVLEGIKEKLGNNVEVIYEKAIDFASDSLMQYTDISPGYAWNGKKGVFAEYFNNNTLQGTPSVMRMEKDIDHRWAEGDEPVEGIRPAYYSARYTTRFTSQKDEVLNFEAEGDDGYRVFVDDSLKINAWEGNRGGTRTFTLPVKKGRQYKIVMEYHQGEGIATIRMKNGVKARTNMVALANRLKDVDAIVFAGGISPQLEGEEMPVAIPGFKGGDRTSIKLPAVQTELLQQLNKLNKPLVFVMMTGSAIAIPWEDENLPAIVNAWYGGQHAGTAVADVLFGDYNPSGRLPVTFYRSDADLPDFSNYDMAGRTYRYFKGKPLYPFGFGLSYTRFSYESPELPARIKAGNDIRISVQVTNTGSRAGDEVVQLYVAHQGIEGKSPVRSLKKFQRIHLEAGAGTTVSFLLSPEDLSLVDTAGKTYQPKGIVSISVGGGQPGFEYETGGVVSKLVRIDP